MQIHNRVMREMLDKGECINVRAIGKEIEHGVFLLHTFIENKDYCDWKRQQWIWSIGRDKQGNAIFASYDDRYYLNPQYECLWLR